MNYYTDSHRILTHWGFTAAKTLIHEKEAVFKILAKIMI